MNKAKEAINGTDRHHSKTLSCLEGEVAFSHLQVPPLGYNLTLRLNNVESQFWIRGAHRIDVGEYVRLHYERGGSGPYVVDAYEILKSQFDNRVKFRFSARSCSFVDE